MPPRWSPASVVTASAVIRTSAGSVTPTPVSALVLPRTVAMLSLT